MITKVNKRSIENLINNNPYYVKKEFKAELDKYFLEVDPTGLGRHKYSSRFYQYMQEAYQEKRIVKLSRVTDSKISPDFVWIDNSHARIYDIPFGCFYSPGISNMLDNLKGFE